MCVLAGVAVTARSAVIVLGSQKLKEAAPLLPILVLGVMLYTLHIFFTAGLIIHKKTVTMVKIVAFSAALNIALNIWLIPRMGLPGAAVSTLISYAVFWYSLFGRHFRSCPCDWTFRHVCVICWRP